MDKTKEKRNAELKELFSNTELSDLEFKDFDTLGELMESLEEQINETEVIYYTNAIRYLSENDASLRDSLAIASEYGYELNDLSSETLATLLQQQNMRDALTEISGDIQDIYEDYEYNEE